MIKAIFRPGRALNFHRITKMTPFSSFPVASTSNSVDEPEVLFDSQGSRRIIILNRPKSLNACTLNMVRWMYQKLKEWNESKEVDLVVIKAAGDKAFCAGGDAIAVVTSAKDALAGGKSTVHRDFFREEFVMNHLINTLSKPYLAFADGIVFGGGLGLAVIGSFCIVTERTLLSMPETQLGLFPDIGAGYFLSRLKSNFGMYLGLCSARIKGADVLHAGLATHYIESSKLPAVEKELASSVKRLDNNSINDLLNSFKPIKIPSFSLEKQVQTIDYCFGGSSVEEIISRLEKDGSGWAMEQVKVLSKMSPTSLKVTHQQITNARKLDYAQTLQMEFRISQRIALGPDLHEGCRAILIDKDRNPKWNPARLEDVTKDKVDGYFTALPESEELKLPNRRKSSKL